MNLRQGVVAAGMVVALGIPGAATATPSDMFRGAWTSVDVDGSSQLLAIGGAGEVRNVLLRDTAGTVCADGGRFIARGMGTVVGDEMTVTYEFVCPGSMVVLGPLTVTYEAHGDQLQDAFGAWFERPG